MTACLVALSRHSELKHSCLSGLMESDQVLFCKYLLLLTVSYFLPSSEGVANLSSIVVYFKDLSCIKYRREMFMTWDGLLASFGGIFGLCLGGSVLSLVEIVYYATFRLYTRIKKNGAQVKNREANFPSVNIIYKGRVLRLPNRPTRKRQLNQIYLKNDPKQFLW